MSCLRIRDGRVARIFPFLLILFQALLEKAAAVALEARWADESSSAGGTFPGGPDARPKETGKKENGESERKKT